MKYSLVEAVQLILSSMDSDEVNSISDTVESMQVAHILKSVYYDIATDLNFAEQETLIELDPSVDPTQPTLLTLPDNVIRITNIKYDTQTAEDPTVDYTNVEFVPLHDFLTMQQALSSMDASTAGSMVFTNEDNVTVTVYFYNDRPPSFFTHLDDKTIVFDAYDSNVDSTVQKTKTLCTGTMFKEFLLEDNFVPRMDATNFSYYINKAKARAFAELKQVPNQEAMQEARRQKVVSQKRNHAVDTTSRLFKETARYGRK